MRVGYRIEKDVGSIFIHNEEDKIWKFVDVDVDDPLDIDEITFKVALAVGCREEEIYDMDLRPEERA